MTDEEKKDSYKMDENIAFGQLGYHSTDSFRTDNKHVKLMSIVNICRAHKALMLQAAVTGGVTRVAVGPHS